MTETIVHCDRCLTRIEADRSLMNVECGPLRRLMPSIDLCGSCSDLLLGWLRDARPVITPRQDAAGNVS